MVVHTDAENKLLLSIIGSSAKGKWINIFVVSYVAQGI